MKGCLSLPFRLLALALLALAGYLAWINRAELRRRVHQWTADSADSTAATAVGIGEPGRAPAVHQRLLGLAGQGLDSVVLSARDLADLLAEAALARAPGAADSIRVELGRGEVTLGARVDTRRVPLGPLGGVLRDHERVEARGRVAFLRPGLGEWELIRARVRGIPLPAEALRLLGGTFGGRDLQRFEVPLPGAVGGLRVSPAGFVIYRAPVRAR